MFVYITVHYPNPPPSSPLSSTLSSPLLLSLPFYSNDPWFHGPWFIRKEETDHLPTRMFYERELFMSNIHDTNPMRSIIRKCVVLGPTEYIKRKTTPT